jgi:hypothetical protein
MSISSMQTILQEVENLTKSEKIQLIEALTKQLQQLDSEAERFNLADFFQNSPLAGVDIDLNRQIDASRSEVEL